MINSNETEIRGNWKTVDGKSVADESTRRIEVLVKQYLKEVRRDVSGWDVLFTDPSDGRFWELTYPQSELHGGGPPLLRWLTEHQVRKKYGM